MSDRLGEAPKRSSRIRVLAMVIVAVLVLAGVAWLTVQIIDNRSVYTKHSPISINGNGGFTRTNGVVGGSGTESDPYIIANWNINASTMHGISIIHTDVHFIVRNCYVHDGTPVPYAGSSYNGIYLYYCVNGTLEDNKCSNNYAGITVAVSSNNMVIGNTCSNNQFGINLVVSTNNTLGNNSCSSNNQDGISVYLSQNNTLTNNSCSSNHNSGISLSYSSNSNDITWNLIHNNTGYGVTLDLPACINNRISYNIIIGNNGATGTYDASHAQARDDGTHNWWNGTDIFGDHGNYWSDWTGPDSDLGGIVDHPYDIPGSAGAKDYYPLSNDPRYIQVEISS